MAGVAFACTCGQIGGTITDVAPRAGSHIVCHCDSCRAADRYLGQPDPTNGVALYVTTPDRVRFVRGQDKLALLCLAPGGLFRWHAACCKAPLFNTTSRPGFPFATLHVARVADATALGPVIAQVGVAKGDRSHRNAGLARLMLGAIRRTAVARFGSGWKRTPFFDVTTKAPVVGPQILTAADRAALGLS